MNLKLALITTNHTRCNCCERIAHESSGSRCKGCKVFYCDSHVADLEEGLCPQCERQQAESCEQRYMDTQTFCKN